MFFESGNLLLCTVHCLVLGMHSFCWSVIPGNFVRSPQSTSPHSHLTEQLSQHMCRGCGNVREDIPSNLCSKVLRLQSVSRTYCLMSLSTDMVEKQPLKNEICHTLFSFSYCPYFQSPEYMPQCFWMDQSGWYDEHLCC